MSRFKERKEKICLNCSTEIQGRFCHKCGQENLEPKETVGHLITHFFQDITHFDGKFFSTVKYLMTRPGFLSKEYMLGRRASYVNPIRMYIFTSAFFFLIFFTFFKSFNADTSDVIQFNKKTLPEVAKMDSATFADYTREINMEENKIDKPLTKAEFQIYLDSTQLFNDDQLVNFDYVSKQQYDSALKAGKDDNWLKRKFTYKIIELNAKYKGNKNGASNAFINELLHSLPQMLFISLPLLALLLKLLYIRRKQYYYVSHGIFSLHLYIFVFIALLFMFSLIKLNAQLHWGFITWLNVLLYFGLFFYEYKAMRKFYQQRRAKTIIKFLLLNLMFYILMALLFIIFVGISILKL